MDPKLTKLFCDNQIEPRSRLCVEICNTIAVREKRARRTRLITYTVIAGVSFIAIVPTTMILVNDLSQSGFGHYASLAFSDGAALTEYWKQFAVTLVESVPVVSLALLLGTILVLGWSSRNALRQTKPLTITNRRFA